MPLAAAYDKLTLKQEAYLQFMAAHEIGQYRDFDIKLTALCEANGIKFKENTRNPKNNSLRARIKEKQLKRKRGEL